MNNNCQAWAKTLSLSRIFVKALVENKFIQSAFFVTVELELSVAVLAS